MTIKLPPGDDLVILKNEINDLIVIYIIFPILPEKGNLKVGTSFGKVLHENPLLIIRFRFEEMQYLLHDLSLYFLVFSQLIEKKGFKDKGPRIQFT